MSRTVEIYVAFPGSPARLAHLVAQTLDVVGYFSNGESFVLPVATGGEPGFAQLALEMTDQRRYGDPGTAAGTAFEPYDFELSLELRGDDLDRFGRLVFDRLTSLGLPLAYGEQGSWVRADFLPDRGVREFPPGTEVEDARADTWGELAEPPLGTAAAELLVFELDENVDVIPVAGQRWQRPRVAAFGKAGAVRLGEILRAAAETRPTQGDDRAAFLESMAYRAHVSEDEFARRCVAVHLRWHDGLLTATARAGAPAAAQLPGPPLDGLVREVPAAEAADELGDLVLDLLAAARSRAAGEEEA